MNLFKVISTSLANTFRSVKVNGNGNYDPRTADEVAPFGTDANPVAGMTALYCDTGNNAKRVIVGYINTQQLAGPGETRRSSQGRSIAPRIQPAICGI